MIMISWERLGGRLGRVSWFGIFYRFSLSMSESNLWESKMKLLCRKGILPESKEIHMLCHFQFFEYVKCEHCQIVRPTS